MHKLSKADVLRIAGEPVARVSAQYAWENYMQVKTSRLTINPLKGMAESGLKENDLLYTESQLLAMYAKGAEGMRERADDLADLVSKVMRKAWHLGQTYWQQTDSEYMSHWKKADATQAKFGELVDSTVDAIRALPITPTNTEGEQGNDAKPRA